MSVALVVQMKDSLGTLTTKGYNLVTTGDIFFRATGFLAALRLCIDVQIVGAQLLVDVDYTDSVPAASGSSVTNVVEQVFADGDGNAALVQQVEVKPEFLDGDGNVIDTDDMDDWLTFCLDNLVGDTGTAITSWDSGSFQTELAPVEDLDAAAAAIHPDASPQEWYTEDGADAVVIP